MSLDVVDKIKKCLRLAKSANANEAAVALRQAQKLMAKHGIDHSQVTEGYSEAVNTYEKVGKTIQNWLAGVVSLVTGACGVEALTDANGQWRTIRYFGSEARVRMAVHAHVVCTRAMMESWEEHRRVHKHLRAMRGARTSFLMGWVIGVKRAIDDYAMTEQDEAIVAAAMAAKGIDRQNLGRMEACKTAVVNDAVRGGHKAAQSFKLHRAVNGVGGGQRAIGVDD